MNIKTGIGGFLKRILDIGGSILFLIITLPLLFIIAILIRIDSKGPIFFLQKRCSKNGVEFNMYKFRTMVKDAELLKKRLTNEVDGPMFKMKTDPRVTKVGEVLRSWSLDELPQLLNVLKGEMSLVGPRPLSSKEMVGDDTWRKIRLSVKPGMTGLWQITGRRSHKFSDWIKYDIEYVQKRSFFLDIKILLLTIFAILRNEENQE